MWGKLFSGVGTTFGIVALVGTGCAVRDDDAGSVADDAAAVEVNVCKRGNEVPPAELEWALLSNYATYNATHGVRVRAEASLPVPFNPIEFGLSVQLPYESHQDALTLDPSHVEACLGSLRILPGAKVQLPSTDASTVAWFCAPEPLDGTRCDLKDGAELIVSVHALVQQHGFVSTTDFLNLRASATTENSVLAVIPPDTPLTLTGELRGNFYGVLFGEQRGWVSRDFVVPLVGTAVTTDGLNLRESASTQAPIQAVIPAGATVRLTGYGSGQFVSVEYQGHWGMASGRFLKSPVFNPAIFDDLYPDH